MDADGTNQIPLTDDPAHDWVPSWSPDGAKIVFASTRDGNEEIYIMNADGNNQTRITDDAARDMEPCWTPDGAGILFNSERTGNHEIYHLEIAQDLTPGTLTQLTDNDVEDDHPAVVKVTNNTP
jgi:Tol biopolymer transport system component